MFLGPAIPELIFQPSFQENHSLIRYNCPLKKEKAMYLWRASVVNRKLNFRIHVEVTAPDYDTAVARAKNIQPGYDEVEWCKVILSFSE